MEIKEMADDTISRKATIDAMENVDWYHIDSDGRLVHGANSKEDEPLYKAKDVYKVLNEMPSAQPKKRTEERTETHACDCIDQIDREPTIEPRCETCEAFNKTRLLIPQPQQQKGKLMRRRTFEEMITYFNQTVSDMGIDRKYKITLLGIVTALLQKHDEDVAQIEPQRKKGTWIEQDDSWDGVYYECSACGEPWTTIDGTPWDNGMHFCPNCGAEMTEGEG